MDSRAGIYILVQESCLSPGGGGIFQFIHSCYRVLTASLLHKPRKM